MPTAPHKAVPLAVPSALDVESMVESSAVLNLVQGENAIVKTVKNGDWLRLLSNFSSHKPFRTSFSLLPSSGRMHLFGQPEQQCCGLVFDRRELDFGSALCWPSGYFAKTEHHLHIEADGSVTLTGGRWSHLVPLDDLLKGKGESSPTRAESSYSGEAADSSLQEEHMDGEPPLYNEISLSVGGPAGLQAVFVRSSTSEDTLFAMGVRALLQHVFPHLPSLPLLRVLGTAPPELVTRAEQLNLLRQASTLAAPTPYPVDEPPTPPSAEPPPTEWPQGEGPPSPSSSLDGSAPRLPVDASAFPELNVGEKLRLHAAHGIGQTSLRQAFDAIVSREGVAGLTTHATHALCAAAVVGNVASAREVVRTAAPLLLSTVLRMEEEMRVEASVNTKEETRIGEAVVASTSTLQRACTAERSEAMLVALGAQITLQEFVAGRTALRLRKACTWLQDWCDKAEGGFCSPRSLVFLASSWAEARKVDGNSDWLSFVSGKAFANRLAFHDELTQLLKAQESGDGLEYIAQLYALSAKLRKPCLRLRILQQILGLDTRFSRDIVHGVVCLAFDVLEEMSSGGEARKGGGARSRPPPPPIAAAGPSQTTSVEDASLERLDSFDEATRLDAEAVLGVVHANRSHPSDPLGESSRQMRVQYYYR